ncbi:MAG: hypothetical protein RML95_10175 [Anaerolineae bacterium]|nr:hypothetical protein [Anaerolineae bacterium]
MTAHQQVVVDTGFQLAREPDTVLALALAFISRERMPPLSADRDALALDPVDFG